MRLIDADALLEALKDNGTYEFKSGADGVDAFIYYSEAFDLVTNAPTVQREGWVSVPIEPTEEMCNAGAPHCKNNKFTSMMVYKAMIQAAPTDTE